MSKFKSLFSKPKVRGPSKAQLKAQKDAEDRAKSSEDRANKQLSEQARFATKRRTGRRLLLAPGREDEIASLGSSASGQSGNF